MRMKLIVLSVSLFSALSFGQTKRVDYAADLKKDFTAFFENIKEKNIENALSFMYPKYITEVTREQAFRVLALSYNNPAFITDIQDFKIGHTERATLINGEYFSVTHLSFTMKYKVDWSVIHNVELAKQKIGDALTERYGKDHITYFSNGDYYLIKAGMKVCGVSEDMKNWKFVIMENDRRSELAKVLPEKIMKKL
ncbi:hypothetical protein [Chryseobacterium sp.]|uniref:hypothetical protein n=1 Tax=Chryseobacterium sp. TaxID=1871047 RepID=UPI0025C3D977|nr:hypothetical protein [Chryseobacterium sp.]MBV8327516.1 hypothetical protein [Chryseobacterium sp.]